MGDIIVLGLPDWKTEIAIMLYQVKPGATNGDLETVTSQAGGEAVAALRRSELRAEHREPHGLTASISCKFFALKRGAGIRP